MKCYVSGEETLRTSCLLSLDDYKKKYGKAITAKAKQIAAEELGFLYSHNIRYFNKNGKSYGFVENYYFTGKLINDVKHSVGLFEVKACVEKPKIKAVILKDSDQYKAWCAAFNLKLIEIEEVEYKHYCETHKHIEFLCFLAEKMQPKIKLAVHRLLLCLILNNGFITEWQLDSYQQKMTDRGFPQPWISRENAERIETFVSNLVSCWNNKKKVLEASESFATLLETFQV